MLTREVARIDCIGAGGSTRTVVVVQRFRVWRPAEGPPQEVPGVEEFYLVSGEDVERLDADSYRVLRTGEVIERIRASPK